jgi:molybdopterin converting factor subunit 1
MRVTVRLFARLREIVRRSELTLEVAPGSTVADVWKGLLGEYPDLAAYSSTMSCAVNDDYAKPTRELREDDEVAFLPPVSGGER